MNPREYVLLIDDDHSVTSALAMLLEREGRTTIVCSDTESAETMLTRYPITHVVTDVQFSGEFGFEGLHFLSRIRAHRPDARIVLMTGHTNGALRTAALGLGANVVLAKPFGGADLDRGLASPAIVESDEPYDTIVVPDIEEVLHGNMLSVVFQPIVQLDGDSVHTVGFEALARAGGTWPGGGTAGLFDYAARRDRLADLNLAALEEALREARLLPEHALLFLNVDPMVFDGGDVLATLRTAAARHAFPLHRIVLEITERSGFGDAAASAHVFDELRADGVRFALDDHGSAYSHLSMISVIRPSFIKISQTFGTGFEEDPTRVRIIKHVIALARDFGCQTILEGIESASTGRAAAEHGVDLVQGYHYGRPAPASHWSAN